MSITRMAAGLSWKNQSFRTEFASEILQKDANVVEMSTFEHLRIAELGDVKATYTFPTQVTPGPLL